MKKSPGSFRAKVEFALEKTRLFSSKVEQVAGKEGILNRLNERHIKALNVLLKNTKSNPAAERVMVIVEREKRILNICKVGLDGYAEILKELREGAIVRIKSRLVNDVNFLLEVVKKFSDGISRLQAILCAEEVTIRRGRSDEIEQLIKELEGEMVDYIAMIRESKPKELGRIRAFYTGLASTKSAKSMGEVIDVANDPFAHDPVYGMEGLGVLDWLILAVLVPASISETLLKVAGGFLVDDYDLKKEIRKLKPRAA